MIFLFVALTPKLAMFSLNETIVFCFLFNAGSSIHPMDLFFHGCALVLAWKIRGFPVIWKNLPVRKLQFRTHIIYVLFFSVR